MPIVPIVNLFRRMELQSRIKMLFSVFIRSIEIGNKTRLKFQFKQPVK